MTKYVRRPTVEGDSHTNPTYPVELKTQDDVALPAHTPTPPRKDTRLGVPLATWKTTIAIRADGLRLLADQLWQDDHRTLSSDLHAIARLLERVSE